MICLGFDAILRNVFTDLDLVKLRLDAGDDLIIQEFAAHLDRGNGGTREATEEFLQRRQSFAGKNM